MRMVCWAVWSVGLLDCYGVLSCWFVMHSGFFLLLVAYGMLRGCFWCACFCYSCLATLVPSSKICWNADTLCYSTVLMTSYAAAVMKAGLICAWVYGNGACDMLCYVLNFEVYGYIGGVARFWGVWIYCCYCLLVGATVTVFWDSSIWFGSSYYILHFWSRWMLIADACARFLKTSSCIVKLLLEFHVTVSQFGI